MNEEQSKVSRDAGLVRCSVGQVTGLGYVSSLHHEFGDV